MLISADAAGKFKARFCAPFLNENPPVQSFLSERVQTWINLSHAQLA